MSRVLFFSAILAVAGVLVASSAEAQLTHRYSFATDLTDSVGDADGVALGDAGVLAGQLYLNLDVFDSGRNGRVDLLANGANGININTYSGVTIEFWAAPNCAAVDGSCDPNPNNSFSTAVGFGSNYNNAVPPADGPNGAGADYIIMQTHRAVDFEESRGAISVTNQETTGAPWVAETGVNGPEYNDAGVHHYALAISPLSLSWYVDGVSYGTTPLAASNSHGNANTLAGVSNDFAWIGSMYEIDQRWAGIMDELRIWDAAGSAEYVANSFAAGPNQLAEFIEHTDIPEPATCGLALLGLCSLGVFRRRARG